MNKQIEQTLSDYLTGFIRNSPHNRELILQHQEWQKMAKLELDRRATRLLELLPDDVLQAIALDQINLAEVVKKLPDE